MTIRIGMLLFPQITQLDLTAPFEVLARVPSAEISLLWKTTGPVTATTGLTLHATVALADAPQFDVLLVPGGNGVIPLLQDEPILSFLRTQAAGARYVTGVCTGSLLLGAAGLLKGHRATTHWAYHHLLSACGAEPVEERVVRDRNRITGGGVTAGVDVGLQLAAELIGADGARAIQLTIEYDPKPPFEAGTPARAGAALTELVRARLAPAVKEYEARLRGTA